MKKSVKIRFITAFSLAITAAAAIIAAYSSIGFANWYSFNIYPVIQNIFSFISGLFPFSLAEIAVILLASGVVGLIIFSIVKLILKLIRKDRKKKPLKPLILSAASTLSVIAASVAFVFVFNCGINYYRSPFSEYSGIKIEQYTPEQVCEVLEHVIARTNELAHQLELDENGICIIPENHLETETAAMKKLAQQYPIMDAYYPHAKPVSILSPLWCYTRIVGMFVPFTMEANYNTCDTPESIGHNICHELSHLTGFMREDEANFISYLACRESDDIYLQFSGYQATLTFLLNAYYPEVDDEEYTRVYSLIDPIILNHNKNAREFWADYQTPVATVSETINDTYLKINNQSDGTKSYGRMVDLVIAEYYHTKGEQK